MKITNNKIYSLAEGISQYFENINTYIPAKANFYISRNFETIKLMASDIEKTRVNIMSHYGVISEDGKQYNIPPEDMEQVIKEFNELFEIEHDLEIKTFKLEDLGHAEFTFPQMQVLEFMIED